MQCTLVIFGLLGGFVLAGSGQEVTFKDDVSLVQLHVRVTDKDGHAVSGLTKTSFTLLVDNIPKTITLFQGEDAPVSAGIVLDNSASMASKREEVIAGALAFARESNPRDEMFVEHFSDHVRLGLPEGQPFTGKISELEKAISAFDLGGTTALYDALTAAISHFGQAVYPRKVLFAITDGGDNSSKAALTDALNAALTTGVAIYAIGIFDQDNRDRNPKVLSTLAQQTSGKAFFPERVSEVTDICVRIAQDIRHQYAIGFPGASDGQYHHILVTAKDSKNRPLQVHTRAGYIDVRPPKGKQQ